MMGTVNTFNAAFADRKNRNLNIGTCGIDGRRDVDLGKCTLFPELAMAHHRVRVRYLLLSRQLLRQRIQASKRTVSTTSSGKSSM